MTVSSFITTDFTTMLPAAYKAAIDANFAVVKRIAGQFSPYASSIPDMKINLLSGAVLNGVTLTEVAVQTSSAITVPSSNPRIDRAVVSKAAGALQIVAGTPSTAPAAPAIPSSYLPVAQISMTSTITYIDNSMITDERTLYVF